MAWANAGKGGVSLCMVMLCFRCGTCKYYDCSCDIQLVRCGAGTDENLRMQRKGEEKAN